MNSKQQALSEKPSLLKKLLPHVIAVIAFLAITMIYFSPLIEGKVLPQNDVKQFQGSSQELRDYYNQEGESSAWTGAVFSGMPAYQIGIWGGSPNFLDYIEAPVKALGNTTAGPMFTAMLLAYILFCIMGFGPVTSALGAIAYSLSSYNIIIIEAGHITKAWALAYMPLIVAGIMALFKRKILLGGIFVALGLALQIKNNHLQITYYTALLCALLAIVFAVQMLREKDIKTLLKTTAVMLVAVTISILCNMGNIYSNMEMARESTRGKSELSTPSTTEKQSSGLDKDYAFGWSYGKAETLSLLIPNIHGGVSKPYDKDSKSLKALNQRVQSGEIPVEFANQVSRLPQYWGPMPFTSGPVYFGIVICFLFVLGMIIIRSNMKWALLAATVFFIFLSWGKHFEWFNDWFFYYFPLYSKFRAPSTALVIPSLTMVMLAVWGIKEFFSGEIDKKKLTKSLYISLGVVGGLCLLLWIAPGAFFNFTADADLAWRKQVPDWFYSALLADRSDLLSADAFRSLIFVLLTGAALLVSFRTKMERQKIGLYISVALVVLVLADLWMVDKRYLNDDNFVAKSTHKQETFVQSPADKIILQDKDISYRVLNLQNPFAETNTSFYHKSIGGYHAAKLKRYQELIDNSLGDETAFIQEKAGKQLEKELMRMQSTPQTEGMNPHAIISAAVQDSVAPYFIATTAINMLNARYIIYHPELPPLVNPYSLGNAWFVREYKTVENADAEIAALNGLNLIETAVVDKRFGEQLSGLTIVHDSLALIMLTEYKPNMLKYKSKAASEQLAVLSEMYFSDGWQAYIDGNKVPHLRANWTLRALRVPGGEHEIVFKFEPKEYSLSRTVAMASSALLILLVIGMCVRFMIRKKKEV